MPSPLIHIGYHKTGTSWLQTHFFNNAAAGYASPVHADVLLERIVRPKAMDFDAAGCRAEVLPAITRAERPGIVPVLSAERLSGNPHSGGYDAHEIAARLRDIFPGARILIVIREQAGAIASCYNQYVKVGGTLTLPDYLNPPKDFRFPQFDFDHFKYDRLIMVYRSLFGAGNVLVLPYEEFRKEPMAFLSKLNAFSGNGVSLDPQRLPLDARVNVSLVAAAVPLQRFANRIAAARTTINQHAWLRNEELAETLSRIARSAGRFVPERIQRKLAGRAETCILGKAAGRYRESNRCVGEMAGLRLSDWGYQ